METTNLAFPRDIDKFSVRRFCSSVEPSESCQIYYDYLDNVCAPLQVLYQKVSLFTQSHKVIHDHDDQKCTTFSFDEHIYLPTN